MTADILERLDFMLISRRSDEDAIIRDARAEIVRLRGEVEARITPEWVIGYFPADVAEEVKRAVRDAFGEWNALSPKPAPAMPNVVEGLVEALEMPDGYEVQEFLPGGWHYAWTRSDGERMASGTTWNHPALAAIAAWQAVYDRAADNRDAAGVVPAWIATWMADREILPDDDGDGISEGALVEALNNHERELLNAIPKAPAAVPAGEAVAYSVVQIGNRGAAYDPPNTHRAFTYEHQPGNIDASRLGRATNAAAVASAGDSIDRGLSLLKELQAIGFGVFQIGPPAPVQAAPQEGECAWDYDEDTDAWNGTCGSMWQFTAGDPDDNDMHYCPKCGKRCALQHRGDSRGGEADRG